MNLVALIGNVANDPEITRLPLGTAVCTLRLAVARPGGDVADFFTIVAIDRQAEVVAEYVQKGRRIGIEGRLETEGSHEVRVIASRVQLLGGPSHGGQS